VTEEFSDAAAVGTVIRTDPSAGEKILEGGAFSIVASKGPAPRVLPELTGLSVDQATAALQALDLIIQLGDQVNDEIVPPGTVISWTVADQPGLTAGATVVRGTSVQVVVSAGPAPRIVPDYTGKSIDEATADLTAVGLVIAQLPDEFSPTVPAGAIARQEPIAGTPVPRGGTVSVAISKGPDLVAVPPLAALTVQQATDALTAAGLTMGTVKGDPTGLAVLAEVDGQSIGADVTLPRGTAVDITFEVPPPPTTVPPETTTTTAPPA
jgi:serine/threonine-protein kinase